MGQLGADSIAALNLQHQGLRRLQDGCQSEGGKLCYRLQQNLDAISGNKDVSVGLNLGYGFSNHLSAGLTLDHSLHRDLPGSYHDRRNNVAAGLYARWQQNTDGTGWYLHPAIGWSSYKVKMHRPTLANTEAGIGHSRVKGAAYSFTAGQDFAVSSGSRLGWYAAVRHSNVHRDAYSEANVAFPVHYGKMQLKDTAAVAGARASIPLGNKLQWRVAAEVEQSINTDKPVYTANAQYVGRVKHEVDVKKTRGQFSTGLGYQIMPGLSLDFDAHVGQSIFGGTSWGTGLKLNGQF